VAFNQYVPGSIPGRRTSLNYNDLRDHVEAKESPSESRWGRIGVQAEETEARERRTLSAFIAASKRVTPSRLLFGPDSPLGYGSERGTSLIDRIETTLDRDEGAHLKAELTEVLGADVPAIFLYPAVWSFVADRRVQGLSSPWRADPVRWANRLWIEE
jgi:hypothetical protein